MNSKTIAYEDIQTGDAVSFEETITPSLLESFAVLSGDYNPLHCDRAFAVEKGFPDRVAYGMLAGVFFSRLVGMHCPGRDSLYVSQTLFFKRPLFPGDRVLIRGTVVSKSDALRIITLQTEVMKNSEVAVSGEAKVKMI